MVRPGQKFGRLVTILPIRSKNSQTYWLCHCVEGNLRFVRKDNLVNKRVRSCGCLNMAKRRAQIKQKNPAFRHGLAGSPEYCSYYQARYRCIYPRSKSWKDYGGRGIKFKFGSFEEFYAELGPKPKGYSLDRIDNDGHYEHGNCRWASYITQARNRRRRQSK